MIILERGAVRGGGSRRWKSEEVGLCSTAGPTWQISAQRGPPAANLVNVVARLEGALRAAGIAADDANASVVLDLDVLEVQLRCSEAEVGIDELAASPAFSGRPSSTTASSRLG